MHWLVDEDGIGGINSSAAWKVDLYIVQSSAVIAKWLSNIRSSLSFFVVLTLCLQCRRSLGFYSHWAHCFQVLCHYSLKYIKMITFVALVVSHFLTVDADSAIFKSYLARTVARKSSLGGLYVRVWGLRLCWGAWYWNVHKTSNDL